MALRWEEPGPPEGPDGGPGPRIVPGPLDQARLARNGFAGWAGAELGLPCFLYGPERTLPEVRREAFTSVAPDRGPATPHPTAGACAVGARGILMAFNVWLRDVDTASTRALARDLREPAVRALGLEMAEGTQVSCNLLDPCRRGPDAVLDQVRAQLEGTAGSVERCELVGLVPMGVLDRIDPGRWEELDLSVERTLEARLEAISRR